METFVFEQWLKDSRLKEKTKNVLQEQDLDTYDDLIILSDEQIEALDITVGQRNALLHAVHALKNARDPPKEPTQQVLPEKSPGDGCTAPVVSKSSTTKVVTGKRDAEEDLLFDFPKRIAHERSSKTLLAESEDQRVLDQDTEVNPQPANIEIDTEAGSLDNEQSEQLDDDVISVDETEETGDIQKLVDKILFRVIAVKR